MSIITLNKLKFHWSSLDQTPTIDIDFWEMSAGEQIFLHGSSGSGKSTFLNLLCGILEPTSGEIHLFGTNFTQLSARERDRFRAQTIGVVFQQFNLIPYLSVFDNLALAAHFAATNKHELMERSQTLCEALGLSPALLKHKAIHLSVGQQQRVAIVRALINHPKLLIADEPTSALDSDLRDQFIQLLLKSTNDLKETGLSPSILFVSHDKSLAHHFDQHLSIKMFTQSESQRDSGADHAL